jgi:hypothetical protein
VRHHVVDGAVQQPPGRVPQRFGGCGQRTKVALDERDVVNAALLSQLPRVRHMGRHEIDPDELAVRVAGRQQDQPEALAATEINIAKIPGGNGNTLQKRRPRQVARSHFPIVPKSIARIGEIAVMPGIV